MPIKEYSCEDCGKVSELLVGIGRNSSELKCSSCGSERLNPMMSVASFSVNQGGSEQGHLGSCCGASGPASAGCAGPGSCCGANR